MIQMEQILQEKKQELEKLISRIKKNQAKCPEGSLRIARDRKHYSFYHYLPAEKEKYPLGKYISRKEKTFIQALAQKDYDGKILEWAEKCLDALEKLLSIYQGDKCVKIYENLGAVRKELVLPYALPSEELARQWLNIPYTGKEIPSDGTCFVTENGEKVRSKSEKILADHFARKGIPYKYECPLRLKGYGTIYPDFTLLNKRTGQILYWEHLGMMDNPEYSAKAIKKIHNYEQNGIFPGKQLLLSYEVKNDLNMDAVDALIGEYLIAPAAVAGENI